MKILVLDVAANYQCSWRHIPREIFVSMAGRISCLHGVEGFFSSSQSASNSQLLCHCISRH